MPASTLAAAISISTVPIGQTEHRCRTPTIVSLRAWRTSSRRCLGHGFASSPSTWRDRRDRVRIVVTVETSAKPRLMIEEGDSLTGVTSRLLAKAPEVRLGEAMREIMDGVKV